MATKTEFEKPGGGPNRTLAGISANITAGIVSTGRAHGLLLIAIGIESGALPGWAEVP